MVLWEIMGFCSICYHFSLPDGFCGVIFREGGGEFCRKLLGLATFQFCIAVIDCKSAILRSLAESVERFLSVASIAALDVFYG